jgi:trimeric autotransporter adhesin
MMSTAIHGKASLADVLPADGTAAGKGADDDRDKTNTVDFGATLTSLIDQASAGKHLVGSGPGTSSPAPGRGKQSADAPTAFERSTKTAATALASSAADAATASGPSAKEALTASESSTKNASTALDSTAASAPTTTSGLSATATPTAFDISSAKADSRFSKAATTPTVSSESSADAPAQQVGSDPSSAQSSSFAALLDDHTLTVPSGVAADQSSLPQMDASGGAVKDDRTAQFADAPADAAKVAQSGVAAMVDSPVPDTNIALDQKTTSSPKAIDDPAPAASAPGASSASNPANGLNPAPIDADANVQIATTPGGSDSAHSHVSRENDGTSSALSTQGSNSDSMNPADPKITQPTSTTPAADATTSSVQQPAQKQIDALAQVAPQDQRARTTNIKDTSSQPAEVSSLANDSAAIANAQPAARAPEVAAIRLTPEVTPASESSRTVSITVQLASGQTAQASVSERAGTVDVKIVTPTAASAQRVSSEMDGMRQNLDAAGIKLGQAEISYQRGEGGGQGREGYQPPAQQQSANGKEVFIMNEVLQ